MSMEAGPSAPHEIRITNHGKIKHWVTVALEHLQKYEDRPLMLHTLPGEKGKGAQSEERVAEAGTESGRGGKRERMKTCMSTIPRLVSVVEIIKREYLKTLDGTVAEGGTLSGLHQYNEIGELDEAGFGEKAGNEEEARLESLARALHGRNHVQQNKVAFMRITLCRKKLPELPGNAATYQAPSVRRLNKSARLRLKNRLKKRVQMETEQ